MATTEMSSDSQDFLQEIDELLSDSKENGDIPSKKPGNDLIEGVESLHVNDEGRNSNVVEPFINDTW